MKLTGMTVSDYMTSNPLTVAPADSLMHALETMRLRGVRRLPVAVDGVLVGLVTEGDLKRAEPSVLDGSEEDFNRVMEETPVSRIMVHSPVTVTADTPLLAAAETLYTTKYGALPVVDGERVIGIITDNDMMHALLDVLRADKERPSV
ncbi:MAG TPA: CBS domain-containing protein [Vicinamibacteria bacterium]|nr:CBS domain-containing protein [Vicinamibacteria bacterium]